MTLLEPQGRDFRRLLSASAVSNFGDGVRLTAIPLLAVAIDARPVVVAGLGVAGYLPWPLFTLFGGAIADRTDRRRLMVRVQVLRMVVVGALAVSVMTTEVGVIALYAVTFVLGMAEVLFDLAAVAAVPAVVPPDQLETANGRIMAAELTANEFVGPPLGGALFSAAHAAPFVVDALSFGFGALALATVQAPLNAEGVGPQPTFLASVREGVGLVWRSPFLRSWSVMHACLNLSRAMTVAVFVLYVVELLDGSSVMFGVLSSFVAVGSVLGSVSASKVVRRFGRPTVVVVSLAANIVSTLAPAVVVNTVAVAVAGVLFGISVSFLNVVFGSARQVVVDSTHLGRVASVQRFLSWGVLPIGALLGGIVASVSNLRAPYVIASGVVAVGSALFLRSMLAFPAAVAKLDGSR